MSSAGARLPDFIGIGAQKAGTTWLYQQLRQHPQLYLPSPKELNFFYRDLATDWYTARFAGAAPAQRCGEISPNYFAQAGVAARMHRLVPDARLFCLLRCPVDRAYSQWKMARRLGNIPPTMPFIDAFRRNQRWLAEQGDYAALIARFESYYPCPGRLRLLFHDDLAADPGGLLDEVCGYLGVDTGFRPASLHDRVWASEDRDTMAAADRAEVAAHYRQSVAALAARTGRDLGHWLD